MADGRRASGRFARRAAPQAMSRWAPLLAAAVCLAGQGLPAAAQNLPPAKPGFPKVLAGEGAVVSSQPLIADLGLSADGTKSIVFGTLQGDLHILYKNAGGTWAEAPGSPLAVGGPINSSPAAGNLSGDGRAEVVVGFGSNGDLTKPGGVKAFRWNGSAWVTLWTAVTGDKVGPSGPDGRPDPVVSTPAIGDVDGDGLPEVAFGSFDFRVHLVNGATGAPEPGWPIFVGDSVWSSPALHDIDGDGRLDVVIGSDAHFSAEFDTPDGGCIHVLRFDTTSTCFTPGDPESCFPNEVAGFPKCVDQVVVSSPVVGDIDGDGKPEIVHGTGRYDPYPNRLERLYAWKCNGSAVPGWPVTIQGQSGFNNGLALADLDGDGDQEVVATADNTRSSSAFHLYAFRGNGSQFFAPQTVRDFSGASLSAGPPVVADVLGADGALEILVPTNTSVAVFSNTGAILTDDNGFDAPNEVAFYTETTISGVAVGDLENPMAAGAKIEVVAVSAEPFPQATNTKVYVWNPVDRSSVPPWGQYRQGAARTGVVPGTASCGASCTVDASATDFFTVTPCRVIDTRRASGPRGGPVMTSGAQRTFALGGSCGVPVDARAVSLNITVLQGTGAGNVRFGPGGCPGVPATSTIDFSAGQTRANNAILPLAVDGTGGLAALAFVTSSGSVYLIVDVNGYFK